MEDLDQNESLRSLTTNILIVGDGNFSFSLAFSKNFLPSNELQHQFNNLAGPGLVGLKTGYLNPNIYATSYDSESVIRKNEKTWANVLSLKEMDHVTVRHEIDATNLNSYFAVKFRKIIFNFPHVGGKSNINACRKLLSNFFQSAALCLDDIGKVFVSLCKGQGGTPCDSGRKGYGNSWQVATQAGTAGFVLVEIKPFGIENIVEYKTAGYRGQLEKGFHKEGSLTHVFIKRDKVTFPEQDLCRSFTDPNLFMSRAEEYFEHQLNSKDPYNNAHHPFLEMTKILKEKLRNVGSIVEANLESNLKATGTEPLEHVLKDLSLCKKNENDINSRSACSQNSPVLCSDTNWHPKTSLGHHIHKFSLPVCFTETFVNPAIDISPSSYPIHQEVIFVAPDVGFASLGDFAEKISHIIDSITMKGVKVSLQNSAMCASVNSSSNPVKDLHYDPSVVPNFISDINMNSWLNFPPQVTISGEESINCGIKTQESVHSNQKALTYRNIDYKDYNWNKMEVKYFWQSQQCSYMQCFEEEEEAIDMYLNDVLVAKCGIVQAQKRPTDSNKAVANRSYMVVFRIDQLCMMALLVEDIRLFWSADNKYLKTLKDQLVMHGFDVERAKPTVLYPLCYRHDLCFWVTESASEKLLFTALHYLTQGAVHSVRLLRILRHEETDLLSFCYRIIYSRCDGPLSHKETVDLQNRLRLVLMDLKFELR